MADLPRSVLDHFTLAMFPRLQYTADLPKLKPPPGLVEILIKFSYEVLRVQPKDIIAFAECFFEQELRRRKVYDMTKKLRFEEEA